MRSICTSVLFSSRLMLDFRVISTLQAYSFSLTPSFVNLSSIAFLRVFSLRRERTSISKLSKSAPSILSYS